MEEEFQVISLHPKQWYMVENSGAFLYIRGDLEVSSTQGLIVVVNSTTKGQLRQSSMLLVLQFLHLMFK